MRSSVVSRWVAAILAGLPMAGVAQEQRPESSGVVALEEVTVTAQRREENLQRAALAVSAVTGDQLVTLGTSRVQDLTQIVPALQVGTAAGPYPLLYLRGVGNFNGNALSDSAVALNLDGVYLARPSSTNGLFYDIDRLEVLKGPQGTLYGRNATGGAINVIVRKPSDTFGGDVAVDAGNEGLLKLNGAINIPLGDTVAARLAVQSIDHDGYLSDGSDDDKSRAGRLQLRFAPNDRLSILTSADFYHQGGRGPGAALLSVPGPGFQTGDARVGLTDPRVTAILQHTLLFTSGDFMGPLLQKTLLAPSPSRLFQDNDYWGVSATLDWESDAGTLTVVPAYRHAKIDFTSITPVFLIDQNESDKQSSLEVRFASKEAGPWSYIVGGFYMRDESVVDPIYDQQINASQQHYEPTTSSSAAFGRLRFSVTDAFRLTAGVRYTHDDKEMTGTLAATQLLCPGVFIPPPAGPQFCFGGFGQVTIPGAPIVLDASKTWSETTWRGGAEWDVGPSSLLYASAETGYKAGGFFFSHDDPTFDPEKITAYTVGSKNRFLEDRLQVNAEAFYWKYRDQQISHIGTDSTGTVIFATENVGKATMQGAELEVQFLATPTTRLGADVQYLDAVYDDFVYSLPNFGAPPSTSCPFTPIPPPTPYTINCSNKTPPQSPRWTLNFALQQNFPLSNSGSIVIDAHTHYQGDTLTGLEFSPEEVQKSYWMSGLSLGYKAPENRWWTSAYVENIEDEDVVMSTFPSPFASQLLGASLRPPRTYGIRLGVNF